MRFIKPFAAIAALTQQGESTAVGEASQYNHIQNKLQTQVDLLSAPNEWHITRRQQRLCHLFGSRMICFKMVNIIMWLKMAEANFRFPSQCKYLLIIEGLLRRAVFGHWLALIWNKYMRYLHSPHNAVTGECYSKSHDSMTWTGPYRREHSCARRLQQ